jgi:ABC-type transport system involved in multi-copper enzyme maturation permease subunit
MKQVMIIARMTFREAIRNKVLYNIFLFALSVFILGIIIGNWSLGEKERVILDFGLAGLHFIALLIAIFIGIQLISKEIHSRTIYNSLAKPLLRSQFLLGKFFGLSVTLFVNLFLLALLLLGSLVILIHKFLPGIMIPIFFIYMEMLIIVAISIFFSIVTSTTLASFLTIFIYISGHLLGPVLEYLQNLENPTSNGLSVAYYLLKVVKLVLPDFGVLNIIDEFVHHVSLASNFYLTAVLYAVFYLVIVMGCNLWLFRRKDLK